MCRELKSFKKSERLWLKWLSHPVSISLLSTNAQSFAIFIHTHSPRFPRIILSEWWKVSAYVVDVLQVITSSHRHILELNEFDEACGNGVGKLELANEK